jgi:AAA domain
MGSDFQRAPYRELHLARRWVDLDQPAPDLDWVVPSIAARGLLTVLSGEGGVGKTSLSLQLAADVGDRHLWGPPELRAYPERSVFLSAENIGALHILAAAMGIGSRSVATFDGGGINLSSEADLYGLAMSLVRGRATFVVLDSLRQFAPGSDENSSNDMAPYVSGLSKLAEGTGCAIVLLHHFNKGSSARGSAAIRDQADFTISLEGTSQENVLRLSPDKWRLGAKPAPWLIRREAEPVLSYELAGQPASKPVTDGLTAKLLAIDPRRVWTTAELRAYLALSADDLGRKRLSKALGPLVESGEIEMIQRGQYRRT